MKRIIIKILLAGIVLCLIPVIGFGQKKYTPGYIINNNLERIEGEVEIIGDIFNAQYVNFNDGKTLMKYTPDQINYWGVEDSRIFISKTIIEDDYEKQVFLEYIIRDNVSLYIYTAENQGIRYFVQKGVDPIRELKMGRRVNEQGMEVVYQEYLGILRILFDDCEETKEQIPSTSFGLPGFTKIVKNYNNCIDPEGVFFERKIKKENIVDIEVLLGYNIPQFSITNKGDEHWYYLQESTVEPKSYLSYGLNVAFNLPKLKGVSLSLGAVFGKWKFDAIYEYELNPPIDMERRIFAYKYTVVTLPIIVRYTYRLNKFKPFVNVGFSYTMMPKNNMELINETYYTDGTVDRNKVYPNILFESRHSGFEAGIGMKYELLEFADIHFEVRYQQGKSDGFPGDATTPDISWLTLNSKTIYILIGLSF